MNAYRQAYKDAGLDYEFFDEAEWATVERDMRAVIAAPSDRAAAKIIAWWGCWDWANRESPHSSPTATARIIRREFRRRARK